MQTGPKMGVRIWNLLGDHYSHEQLGQNFMKIDLHDHSPGRGAPVGTAGLQDGAITPEKLAPGGFPGSILTDDTLLPDKFDDATILSLLGLTGQGVIRRAKSVITGTGTRTSTSYGDLNAGAAPGPDQVTVTTVTSGWIVVGFQGVWSESVAGNARAAFFVDGNQLKNVSENVTAPLVQETGVAGSALGSAPTAGTNKPLVSMAHGLESIGEGAANYTDDVTTGQTLGAQCDTAAVRGSGNLCIIQNLAAGSHTVSVRFKSNVSGTVSAKSRRLWAFTVGF